MDVSSSPKTLHSEWQECETDKQTASTFRTAGWPHVSLCSWTKYLLRFICISWFRLNLYLNLQAQHIIRVCLCYVLCQRRFCKCILAASHPIYTIIHCISACSKVLLPAWVFSLQNQDSTSSFFTHMALALTGWPGCCHVNHHISIHHCLFLVHHRPEGNQWDTVGHTEAKS